MSRDGKIKLFIHLMKLQNKAPLIRFIMDDIRKHEIFDIVDPQYITKIVHEFRSIGNLDIKRDELKLSLDKSKSSSSTSHDQKKDRSFHNGKDRKRVDHKQQLRIRSLYCSDLLKQVP